MTEEATRNRASLLASLVLHVTMNSTESWLLLCSVADNNPSHSLPTLQNMCRHKWRACLQFCLSVPTIERVIKTAFETGYLDPSEAHVCRQQLLSKRYSLHNTMRLAASQNLYYFLAFGTRAASRHRGNYHSYWRCRLSLYVRAV